MDTDTVMEIGTKEGWRQFVDTVHERPPAISTQDLAQLSKKEKNQYNTARARFMQAGAFVKTPQFKTAQRAVRERILLNTHRQVGKLGVIISGEPAQGKTTTLLEIGKDHELRRRQTGHPAAGDGHIPVAYVAVPAQCTAKALLQEFARFYALPVHSRMLYGVVLDMVANTLRRCRTELVLIDDVHHLDLRYKQNIEASDMLKQLSERCGGTFVFAGIAVEQTGLLSGTREGQMRKRFEVHTAAPFGINTKQRQIEWGDLLLSIESSLCLLDEEPGAILAAAKELHHLTGGEIGLLKDHLQLLALRAIEDGTERIDTAAIRRGKTGA